ncbi:MAG: CcdB family protein [Candidatus Dechloromonas phosphoritropha]|jgi:toxin CcdB
MAQFDVHRNPNAASAKAIPFLLDVQADLLSGLVTRVAVPLARPDAVGNRPAHHLNPVFDIEGGKFVMLTSEMAGIPVKRLGQIVVNLGDRRTDIIRALDVVFSGV